MTRPTCETCAIPRAKIKLNITRKPPPPPLDPFTCAICEQEIKRDSYNPEWERPPVCNGCAWRTPTRPRLAWTNPEQWGVFTKAHALLCAIEQEIKNARAAR